MKFIRPAVFFLILLPCLIPGNISAQTKMIDSLQNALHSVKSDSAYVEVLLHLSKEYMSVDSSVQSRKNAEHALAVAQGAHYMRGIFQATSDLGTIYLDLGDYTKALEMEFKCLAYADSSNDLVKIAATNNSIGIIYWYQSNLDKALEYYMKALDIQKQRKDTVGISGSLNNIGIVCKNKGDTAKALFYYRQALDLSMRVNNKRGMANTYNNLGALFELRNDLDRALNYFQRSLYIRQEINDKIGISTSLTNIGDLYLAKKEYEKAEQYELDGLGISREIGDLEGIKAACSSLSEIYAGMKDGMKALKFYQEYIAARDSLSNEEGKHNMEKMEMRFQYENDKLALKKDTEKQQALAESEKRKQGFIIIAVSAGLVMVLIFLAFILNRFRLTRRQKQIIEKQKVIVEEKNEEITASIQYAKRIQESHLPTEKFIEKTLKRLRGGE
ncbi:MAG: tetratricopeptide repeat protein [Bacteroidetes bacterium]|nr:tetratricopeptide repeat protein [Bacteroidota bacterium]